MKGNTLELSIKKANRIYFWIGLYKGYTCQDLIPQRKLILYVFLSHFLIFWRKVANTKTRIVIDYCKAYKCDILNICGTK